MATTAATQAAQPAPPPSGQRQSGEQAFEATRARRRVQWQIITHIAFVVVALAIGAYVAARGKKPMPPMSVLLRLEVFWLVLGASVGALFAWLIPWLVQDRKFAPYVFVSPFFIIFFTFGVFPLLFSLFLAFNVWDPTTGLGGMHWAGWEKPDSAKWLPIPANFYFAVTDPYMRKAAWNTVYIAVASGVPQHLVGMPLAYVFHVFFKRFRNAVTGAYFLPFITSSVAISLIFSSLFSQHFGVLNALIDSLSQVPGFGWLPYGNDEHINWLGRAPYVKPAISFVVWWRYLGWNTVLYLSALQAIPNELFEAAEMDGANRRQTFTRVVVPLLRPMMFFAVTLTIIGNFQLFEEPFIITGGHIGGPESSGMTAAMFMYKYIAEFEYGTASAISWILFAVIALLTWLNQVIFSRQRGSEGVA